MRVLLLLVVMKSVVAAGEERGELCIGPGFAPPCATAVSFSSVPSLLPDQAKTFRWVREDGRQVILGAVPPDATRTDDRAKHSVRAVVVTDRERWPTEVGVRLTPSSGPPLLWTISGNAPEFFVTIVGVRPVPYTMELSAEHHETATLRTVVGNNGRITLRRLPTITGRVTQKTTGAGAPGVHVCRPTGAILAVSDAHGDFEFELGEPWPDHLRFDHPAYGLHVSKLPKTVRDADLGVIGMEPGTALQVTVDGGHPREARLFSVENEEEQQLVTRVIADGTTELTFPPIAAGNYRLLITGDTPFQKYSKRFSVPPGGPSQDVHVEIRTVALDLRVTRRQEPVAQAEVVLISQTGNWRQEATTDAEGTVRGELWQEGDFVAAVEIEGRPAGFYRSTLLKESGQWHIALAEHSVSGYVKDARSGAGVPHATVFLKTSRAESETLLRAQADENGYFVYESVAEGEQTVTVDAAGYAAGTRHFRLDAGRGTQPMIILLDRAKERLIRAYYESGTPARNALVVVPRGRPGIPIVTNTEGTAEITVAADGMETVYVLPKEGSFGFTVVRGSEDTPIVVTIPLPEASILVRTQDEKMTGIPNVRLLLRYNGHLVPPEVLREMNAYQGVSFISGMQGRLEITHMPVGLYELWPYFQPGDESGLRRTEPPLRIAVQPGPNSAILTFRERRP